MVGISQISFPHHSTETKLTHVRGRAAPTQASFVPAFIRCHCCLTDHQEIEPRCPRQARYATEDPDAHRVLLHRKHVCDNTRLILIYLVFNINSSKSNA